MEIIKKLNFKLIVLHLFAAIFIVMAAKVLTLLYDLELVEKISSNTGKINFNEIENHRERIGYFMIVIFLWPIIALLISFLISLIISKKCNIHWLNSLIVLVLGLLLNKLGMFELNYMKKLLYILGEIFTNNLLIEVIINSTIFTCIGLFIFFNKCTMKYIRN